VSLEAGAVLWHHAIYPHAEFGVQFDYLTELQRSRNGHELRRAWRDRPRKRIQFTTRVAGECFRNVVRDIYANQRKPWAVPDISRRVASVSTMPAAGTQISVTAEQSWMVAAETIILISGSRTETRTIDTVGSGGVLTFVEINAVEWPVGTYLMPALPARFEVNIGATRRRTDFVDFRASFQVTPTFELYVEPPAAASTFKSRELFTTPPRSIEPVDLRFLSDLEVVDFDTGAIAFNEPVTFPTEIDRYDYSPCDAPAMRAIENLFIRARGQRGSFYMPTFGYDLIPAMPALLGAGTLTVKGANVATNFAASTVFKNIAIQYLDGSWQAMAVSLMSVNGSNTDLTLTGTLSGDVNVKSIRRISWLPRRRFAGDRISAAWRYDRGSVTLPVRTIEDT